MQSEYKCVLLTCPHCGAKKEVVNRVPGDSFSRTVWSDNKVFAPTQPKASFVQKCTACGSYYLLSQQKVEYSNGCSTESDELSYEELKEAWSFVQKHHNLTENERLSILIMQVWRFNDKYTRNGEVSIPNVEYKYIVGIIDQLLELDMVDDFLKAEMLRERGRFDEAIELFDKCFAENGFLKDIKSKFKEYSLRSDTRPFVIGST